VGVGTSPGAYADGRTTEDLTCAGAAALTDARVRRWRPSPTEPRGRTRREDASEGLRSQGWSP